MRRSGDQEVDYTIHPPTPPKKEKNIPYEKKPLNADGEKPLKKQKENIPPIFQNKHTLKIRTITTPHPTKKNQKTREQEKNANTWKRFSWLSYRLLLMHIHARSRAKNVKHV